VDAKFFNLFRTPWATVKAYLEALKVDQAVQVTVNMSSYNRQPYMLITHLDSGSGALYLVQKWQINTYDTQLSDIETAISAITADTGFIQAQWNDAKGHHVVMAMYDST
jgi:hypothetical protein